MKSPEVRRRALNFLHEAISRLRSNSFASIQNLPDYPASASIDLGVPRELIDQRCTFALMKDTLPDGAIRVAVQYSRPRFMGLMTDMVAQGFRISADGTLRELSEKDHWDLT